MVKTFEEATFEIFDGFGFDGSLIRKAATTCYRSEDTTQKTAEDFIRMLKKNKHLAMLEFCYIPLCIVFDDRADEYHDYYALFREWKHFTVTPGKFVEAGDSLIVSANARAWIEYADKCFSYYGLGPIETSILNKLRDLNPVLFDFNTKDIPSLVTVIPLQNPKADEHKWIGVKFSGVSRGFTHELVRHRVMSFAQVSTRYVNYDNFDFIFPIDEYPNVDFDAWLESTKRLYEDMIHNNVPKQIARQVLPTGISTEICVGGTVKLWKGVFELRCASGAHPEIRTVMTKLKDEFIQRGLL